MKETNTPKSEENIFRNNGNLFSNPNFCYLLQNEECAGARDFEQFSKKCSTCRDAHYTCNYDSNPIGGQR